MNIFQSILEREVNRKQFLVMIFTLIFTITGIKQLQSSFKSFGEKNSSVQSGFGNGAYGA